MDSLYEEENCIYLENHSIYFINNTSKVQDYYTIKVYSEQTDESSQIRINISSAKDETISYTSIITPASYKNMQKDQDLHISYEEFAQEFKSLLSNSKTRNITIKFSDIGLEQELGFYTMTSVKEIKLLWISFIKTPSNKLVHYFKQKSEFYVKRCKALETQLSNSKHDQDTIITEHQKQLDELQDYYKNENIYLKNAFDSYKSELNNNMKKMTLETEQLKNKICLLNEDRKKISIEILRRDNIIKDLQQNLTELNSTLKYITIKNEQQMVSLEKYDKIKKLFSSTLADLLKYQMCLKKVQNLSEMQKEENGRLREDIKSCVNYIMSVSHDDNVLAQIISENKNVLENIGALDGKIAQLQLDS